MRHYKYNCEGVCKKILIRDIHCGWGKSIPEVYHLHSIMNAYCGGGRHVIIVVCSLVIITYNLYVDDMS